MRRITRLTPFLALPVILAACGSSPSTTAPAPTPSSALPSASASASPTATTSAKLPVNQSITDAQTGDQVTVVEVVRNFPVPAQYANAYKEAVLVHVKVTAGSKYYTGVQPEQFSILEPRSDIPASESSIFAPQMTSAGYTPLPQNGVDSGTSGEGWVAITLSKANETSLQLQYKRQGFKVLGSSSTVPDFVVSAPVPDAK